MPGPTKGGHKHERMYRQDEISGGLMKTKLHCLLAAILGVWLVGTSLTALARLAANPTEAEWALIPRYCPDTQGYEANYRKNRAKWDAIMGAEYFSHLHHYCWARITLLRAQRATITKQEKQALLIESESDLLYVLQNTRDDFILLPEVLTWMGRTKLLLHKPLEADTAFSKARALKPDYWPAYSYWADFLLLSGRKAEALALVKVGLQHAPQATVLNELFRSLGGRPGDIPPPIIKNADHPVQETPTPEQPENPPVTSTKAQGQN